MKWLRLTMLCVLLLPWSMLPGSSAIAGHKRPLEVEPTPAVDAIGPTPLASTAETVVVISGSPDAVGAEVVVKGGPSQSVRVIAPSNITVTAIGGDGPA